LKDLIDIAGASGARYRFRLATDRGFTPMGAGNYVYIRCAADTYELTHCGSTNSLSRTAAQGPVGKAAQPDTVMYVRLNVSRAVREDELADVVAGHADVTVSVDSD
jgi:hypothetical protein